MTRVLLDLPSHVRRRLASALATGVLGAPYTSAGLRAAIGAHESSEAVVAALGELARLGVIDEAAAHWLDTLDRLSEGAPRPDLVWSGPEVPGVHARDTRRVFEELIGAARHSILASTYAFFDGPRAFGALARAMEERRELKVQLLLNIQRQRGDTTPADHLVRSFADRLWKTQWPGSVRPDVFYDPRALEPDRPAGVLHAKALVVDDEAVLVTSANLTEAAFDRNIELGILVRDPALAASVTCHYHALIAHGLLVALPGE